MIDCNGEQVNVLPCGSKQRNNALGGFGGVFYVGIILGHLYVFSVWA